MYSDSVNNSKNNDFLKNNIISNKNLSLAVGDSTESSNNIKPVKYYDNAFQNKTLILKENKGLAGVYKWTNNRNNNTSVGSSIELSNRFTRYFNRSYLKSNNYVISKALLKYGYEKFTLEILEYCDASIVLER